MFDKVEYFYEQSTANCDLGLDPRTEAALGRVCGKEPKLKASRWQPHCSMGDCRFY